MPLLCNAKQSHRTLGALVRPETAHHANASQGLQCKGTSQAIHGMDHKEALRKDDLDNVSDDHDTCVRNTRILDPFPTPTTTEKPVV